jgi:hypothetical protein
MDVLDFAPRCRPTEAESISGWPKRLTSPNVQSLAKHSKSISGCHHAPNASRMFKAFDDGRNRVVAVAQRKMRLGRAIRFD